MNKQTSCRFLKYLSIVGLCIVIFSCQKEELEPVAEQEPSPESQGLVKTVLGKKLENPYSVASMKQALENLQGSNPNGRTALADIEIETTDYYVRFFARTDEEIQQLEADSLPLYDYPLDHEIDSSGDYYIDPEADPEEGKWFYTSVPVDYQFPDMQYEILEELFLIDEGEEDSTPANGRSAENEGLLQKLEYEALRITNNLTKEELETNKNGRCWIFCQPSKRYPTGYVRVYDTERRRLVGVEYVRVRTRRWFRYGYAYTNSSGYYRINRDYRRPVNYSVFFQNRQGFKIRASIVSLWKAKVWFGKHTRDGHNINMYTNSRGWRFSTVNNAVVKYRRYCSQLGVGLPPSNLRIVASNSRSRGAAAPMLKHVWGFYGFTSKSKVVSFLGKVAGLPATILQGNTFFRFVLPDIFIKANSSKRTSGVYATTFHELAHASHYSKVGNRYWIKYINYVITYGAYGNGTGNHAGVCGIGEMWANYFGAVCMDKEWPQSNGPEFYLSKNYDWYNPGFLKDVFDISDVDIAEIFSCLTSGTDTFGDLRNQLKTKTNHDAQVDNAWNKYTDWP